MANIENEIAQIENAIYGKDVRNALANGLNAINNQTNDATGILNKWFDKASSKYSGMDVANIQKNIVELEERNKNVLSGSVNLLDGSNYGLANNGGKKCSVNSADDTYYNPVGYSAVKLSRGITYTATMLVVSPIPNFSMAIFTGNGADEVYSERCTTYTNGYSLIHCTFKAKTNDFHTVALYNYGGSPYTSVLWCSLCEGTIPNGWSPSIKDIKGSTNSKLMALGKMQTNLAITSFRGVLQAKQLGKDSINIMLDNIKLKKENDLINQKLDFIGKQLVQLQLKKIKSEVK